MVLKRKKKLVPSFPAPPPSSSAQPQLNGEKLTDSAGIKSLTRTLETVMSPETARRATLARADTRALSMAATAASAAAAPAAAAQTIPGAVALAVAVELVPVAAAIAAVGVDGEEGVDKVVVVGCCCCCAAAAAAAAAASESSRNVAAKRRERACFVLCFFHLLHS